MVEFGEQLRRAREDKGMTQQSLAEQLYVTRQAVSRWECGDRYPDLLTTKKISQILDVSLDDLLSGKEMIKVVERNPVVENKVANGIMTAIYSFIVISFIISVIDIIIRFPLQSEMIDYSDIQMVVVHVLVVIIQIVFFIYGLVQAVRGSMSPKRMGAVNIVYFVSMCLMDSENVTRLTSWQIILIGILLIVPHLLGAIANFFYYVQNSNNKIWPYMIYITSAWGIFRIAYSAYDMIVYAGQYWSMNTTVSYVLKIAIYVLIVYQTVTLSRKRMNAKSIDE